MMPWDVTWTEFSKAFWPQFVASIITGGILGILFSWLIAKRIGQAISNEERKRNIRDKEREKLEIEESQITNACKSIQLIMLEVDSNHMEAKNKLYYYQEGGVPHDSKINLESTIWNSLITNLDLLNYIDNYSIKAINKYYKSIQIVFEQEKEYNSYYLELIKKKIFKEKEYMRKIYEGAYIGYIESFIKDGENLLYVLNCELDEKKKKIEDILHQIYRLN